jgi:hypothetical protein
VSRASVGLAALAGITFLMLTFAGVSFAGVAAYFALADYMRPWLAALITAGILLLPLLVTICALLWSSYRRRMHRKRRLAALRNAISAAAQADPYGFLSTAFLAGMALARKPVTMERMAECVAAMRKSA